MSGKKRRKEKEYTVLQNSLICVGVIVVIYIIFALILTVAVSREKLNPRIAYPSVLAALLIATFIGVQITTRGNKEKRLLTAAAAAGIITCALIILPVAINRGLEFNHVWKSIVCVWMGCLPAAITGRIKKKRKRR